MEKCKRKGLLFPEYLFKDMYELTPEFLHSHGIKVLIFDIDNTIAPYEVEEPTEKMKQYLLQLRDANFIIAFVSNNHGDRVSKFNQSLGFPQYCNAKKPFAKATRKILKDFSVNNQEAISIGDQLLTDCISAHCAGIPFILVPPIRDKKTVLFKIKRTIEKPFVKTFSNYQKYSMERTM